MEHILYKVFVPYAFSTVEKMTRISLDLFKLEIYSWWCKMCTLVDEQFNTHPVNVEKMETGDQSFTFRMRRNLSNL